MFYKYGDVNICVCATNIHICHNEKNCEILRMLKDNIHNNHECYINMNNHMANILFKSIISEETRKM